MGEDMFSKFVGDYYPRSKGYQCFIIEVVVSANGKPGIYGHDQETGRVRELTPTDLKNGKVEISPGEKRNFKEFLKWRQEEILKTLSKKQGREDQLSQ